MTDVAFGALMVTGVGMGVVLGRSEMRLFLSNSKVFGSATLLVLSVHTSFAASGNTPSKPASVQASLQSGPDFAQRILYPAQSVAERPLINTGNDLSALSTSALIYVGQQIYPNTEFAGVLEILNAGIASKNIVGANNSAGEKAIGLGKYVATRFVVNALTAAATEGEESAEAAIIIGVSIRVASKPAVSFVLDKFPKAYNAVMDDFARDISNIPWEDPDTFADFGLD